jgi:ribosomal protein S18 acetylase RimI-like enzyme
MTNTSRSVFRLLQQGDVDSAVAILDAASQWLLARGIRQWTTAYPRDLYQQLQERGESFGLFEEGRLVAIVTLTGPPPEWDAELSGQSVRWISKLAVAPDCHGRSLGRLMAGHALDQLRRDGASQAWLDCRNGSLVAFYESLGFEQVTAKVVDFPDVSLELVLMKRDLQTPASVP